jgi:hypothetical protein
MCSMMNQMNLGWAAWLQLRGRRAISMAEASAIRLVGGMMLLEDR